MQTRRWAVRLLCVAIIVFTSIRSFNRPLQLINNNLNPLHGDSYSSSSVTISRRKGRISNRDSDDPGTATVYNDTRPIGPNGYLCVFGAKGRLNNKIIQNLVGIYMAHHLNRTLLVDEEVSTYYDIDRLSLMTYPDSPFIVATTIGNRTCRDPKRISPYAINHGLNIHGRFDEYHKQTQELHLASVDNSDVWYWLGRPPEEVYDRFFQGLIPRQIYLGKVDAFLDEHQIDIQNPSYNALHLRYFEGKCGNFDTDLCCPKYDYVKEILVERDGNARAPLFIANDGQCSAEVQGSYTNATILTNNNDDTATTTSDVKIINGYNGECIGTECAVLDFELCVRSDVFIGNLKSSGDWNIREWRVARYDKPGRASVLSRGEEVARREMEEGGGGSGGSKKNFLTRWIIGHWRFVPDCDQIGARQRNKPCV